MIGRNKTEARPWTKADLATLRKLYPEMSGPAVAERMGRGLPSIKNQAVKLGLRKSDAYFAGKPGAFKAGHKPWNKDKPGSTGTHPNCRKSWFKAGHLGGQAARNYQRTGSLRIKDDLLERKVSDDPKLTACRKWRAVHRMVWEAANGPVPRGHVVVFKPGRKTHIESEITLDRVELITRAENMRRNSYHTRYPREVAQLIQLRGALNRKINNRTRNKQA